MQGGSGVLRSRLDSESCLVHYPLAPLYHLLMGLPETECQSVSSPTHCQRAGQSRALRRSYHVLRIYGHGYRRSKRSDVKACYFMAAGQSSQGVSRQSGITGPDSSYRARVNGLFGCMQRARQSEGVMHTCYRVYRQSAPRRGENRLSAPIAQTETTHRYRALKEHGRT